MAPRRFSLSVSAASKARTSRPALIPAGESLPHHRESSFTFFLDQITSRRRKLSLPPPPPTPSGKCLAFGPHGHRPWSHGLYVPMRLNPNSPAEADRIIFRLWSHDGTATGCHGYTKAVRCFCRLLLCCTTISRRRPVWPITSQDSPVPRISTSAPPGDGSVLPTAPAAASFQDLASNRCPVSRPYRLPSALMEGRRGGGGGGRGAYQDEKRASGRGPLTDHLSMPGPQAMLRYCQYDPTSWCPGVSVGGIWIFQRRCAGLGPSHAAPTSRSQKFWHSPITLPHAAQRRSSISVLFCHPAWIRPGA